MLRTRRGRSVDMARRRPRRSRTGGRSWPWSPSRRPPSGTPRSCAISAATCATYAGSLRLPRNGTGARYGESVSISSRSSGTRRATSFDLVRVLERDDARQRDVEAEIERGPCDVPGFGEAVHHAAGVARTSSRMIASVSAAAARVWITSGLPRAAPARMCTRKRSRCQPRSPVEPIVVESRLADRHHLWARASADEHVDRGLGRVLGVGVHADGRVQIGMRHARARAPPANRGG